MALVMSGTACACFQAEPFPVYMLIMTAAGNIHIYEQPAY